MTEKGNLSDNGSTTKAKVLWKAETKEFLQRGRKCLILVTSA